MTKRKLQSRAREDGARRIADAFNTHPGRNIDGALTVTTRFGSIRLAKVEYAALGGRSWVDVWVGNPSDSAPAYRVVNPPILMETPRGEIARGNRRYTEDPLGALAEVIGGMHRGVHR
jgi:hypothetical protein